MRKGFLAVMAVAVSAALPAIGHAATFKPTRLDDPKPGKCKPGNCSLREAISAANARIGRDKVVLSKGTYVIQRPENLADNNGAGDFDVIDKVKIVGKGPRNTVVDGQDVSRVFSFLTFPAHSIAKLTIQNGNAAAGAGILIGPSKATIKDVVLNSNTATETGGGLETFSTNLTVLRTTFTGNDAANGGGGIYSGSGIAGNPSGAIKASTFSFNTGALGGGLYLDGANPPSFDDDPAMTVLNSTFSNNEATVSGGGIASILGAALSLDQSTIAYNVADSDNSGGGSGGGMFQSSSADANINDIVLGANSVGTSGSGPQCSGTFTGGGLIAGSTADCTIGGQFVADAMIGPLADNGGPTQTIALLVGSPAIDRMGFDCPKRDQRGRKRNPDACDSGAFERKPNDP